MKKILTRSRVIVFQPSCSCYCWNYSM